MESIIIGIALIVAGIAYAVYTNKKMSSLNLEVQSIETSRIVDAKDIVDELSFTDENYRHYVELKGTVYTDEQVIAPFSDKAVSYYEDKTFAVSEDTETYRDSNGNHRTRTTKREDLLSHEKSSVQLKLRDASFPQGINVDLESFSGCMDLQSGCDRFENDNSDWMMRHNFANRRWGRGSGSKFLGYRFIENILLQNQPVYVLGELYKLGDTYCVARSRVGNKPSKFTYKSEEELVAGNEKAKKISLIVGAVATVIGLLFIVSGIR